MSVPQGQAYQFTRIGQKLNDSLPSALPGIPGMLTALRSQQNAPHDLRLGQQFQHVEKGPAAMSSRSSRQADVHESHKRRYLCDTCGKDYALISGLNRHQRETHKPSLCRHCGSYEWGRRYLFKEHLERSHPGVNLDAELEEIKWDTHSAATVTGYPPQVSPPTPQLGQRGLAESQPHPPTLPPPAMTELPPVSLPAFPPAAYHPLFEFAEPTSMEWRRESTRQFAAPTSSYACTPFPLVEERPQMARGLGVYAHAQIRFARAFVLSNINHP